MPRDVSADSIRIVMEPLPVVLHHGLFGYAEMRVGPLRRAYFSRIDRAIADRGHPVILSQVHPTAAIATRARQLKRTILDRLESLGRRDDRVIVVAHSMGGLDARYMISKLGMDDRVAALITITTPHRGSPYADWCVRNLGKRLGGLRLMNFLRLDVEGIIDLTTESCSRFNEDVIDAPDVRYFSVSAARPGKRLPTFALHSHGVIHAAEGDNDGLVSLKSSKWGGQLGVWEADHWQTINREFKVMPGERFGDVSPKYLDALEKIAEWKSQEFSTKRM